MLTICRSAKGGSGATTVTALLALSRRRPSLVVDLAGDQRLTLGVNGSDRPGVFDWLTSEAPLEHLDDLLIDLDDTTVLLPALTGDATGPFPPARLTRSGPADATGRRIAVSRWMQLASWTRSWAARHDGFVVIDAPTSRGTEPAVCATTTRATAPVSAALRTD